MEFIRCKVISKLEIKNAEFWKLREEESSQEYVYPLSSPGGDSLEIDRVYNFKRKPPASESGKVRLEFTKNIYRLNETYILKIVGQNDFINKLGKKWKKFEVMDNDGQIEEVLAHSWQSSPLWNFDTIPCKFMGFGDNGRVRFENCDFQHPLYEVGKEYIFTVLEIENRINADGIKFEIIRVKGQDDIVHEVTALPNQKNTLALYSDITCLVVNINYKIRLRQVNPDDPYFIGFEKLFEKNPNLSKHFKSILKKSDRDFDEDHVVEQYENKSAFWVFTYCSKVLPKYFCDFISRYDYINANEINETILFIENWILKGGIISSFKNKLLATAAAEKVISEIQERKTIRSVLETLKSQNYFSVTTKSKLDSLDKIYYVIDFCDFDLIDDISYIQQISNLLSSSDLNPRIKKLLTLLAEKVGESKKQFIDHKLENIFELIENGNARFESAKNKSKFFNWSYCEYLIYRHLEDIEKANILLAILIRQYFYVVDDLRLKKDLILQSYYTLSYSNSSLVSTPFTFSDGIKLRGNIGENLNFNNGNFEAQSDIADSFHNDTIIIVKVGKRLLSGFQVTYNGHYGFLKNSQIEDANLKSSVLEAVDYSLAVTCTLFSKEFNFFIVQPLPIDHPNYYIRNHSLFANNKLVVRRGRITSIKDYGIHVESELGPGLIHLSEISDNIWDSQRLEKHFKINTNIYFVLKSIQNERLNFSLKLLYDTDCREKYNEFTNRVDEDYLSDIGFSIAENSLVEREERLAAAIQVEKAYCFEQFALSQTIIENKILNLKLASELFEVGRSLRSDYASIYTSYFETLQSLEKALTTYSDETLGLVNKQVSLTLDKITETALLTFPDFDKLLYFLRIIQLFNSKADEDLDELYRYVKKYSASQANENLKTVAKITLSNNLMVSAGEHVTEYSKRSLSLIYNYIQNGVLSLKETEEDSLRKELERKVRYWKGKILQDEGSNLEFKASLRTPILDEKRKEILKSLKLQEQSEEIKLQISKIEGQLATKGIVHSAMKSICAFANTNGGTLLIGVSDNKAITGVEIDYQTLTPPNRDGLGKVFDEYIKAFFGDSFSNLLDKEFLKFPEGDVLIVNVKPAIEEIFMLRDKEGKAQEELYIRHLSSTVLLTGRELVKFVRERNRTQIPVSSGINEIPAMTPANDWVNMNTTTSDLTGSELRY